MEELVRNELLLPSGMMTEMDSILGSKNDIYPDVTVSDFTCLIFGEITIDTARRFCRQMLDCSLADPSKPVKIIINSPGGDVSAMWSMIATMQQTPNPKFTYALGEAQSAAFVLLISGDIRIVYENTLLMDHESYSQIEGTFTQLTSQQKMLDQSYQQFRKHYESCTGLSWAELKKTIFEVGKNIYLSPEEAMRLNCVDAILKANPRPNRDILKTTPKEAFGENIIVREITKRTTKKSISKRNKNA